MSEAWEIVYRILVGFAASCLYELGATGVSADMLTTAYGTNNLKEWARAHILDVLNKAEIERNGRQLSELSRDMIKLDIEALKTANLWVE